MGSTTKEPYLLLWSPVHGSAVRPRKIQPALGWTSLRCGSHKSYSGGVLLIAEGKSAGMAVNDAVRGLQFCERLYKHELPGLELDGRGNMQCDHYVKVIYTTKCASPFS